MTPEASAQVDPAAPETAETNGTPTSPDVKAVDPQTPPVDPDKPKTDDKAKAPDDSDSKIKELEEKLASARSEAAKSRIDKNNAKKAAGDFEGLYRDLEKEHQEAAQTLAILTPQLESAKAENKELRKQLDGFKASWVEKFDESDRELAAATPLDKLPALYERLNQGQQLTPPPTSYGNTRIPQRGAPPKQPESLAEINAQKYGTTRK